MNKSRYPCKEFIKSVTIIFSENLNDKSVKKINTISRRNNKLTVKRGSENKINIYFIDNTSVTLPELHDKNCNNDFKSLLKCKNFNEVLNYLVIW